MYWELALISVVVAAGYWGLYFVRRRPHGSITFGVMQLAAAGLSGLGLLGRSYEGGWLDIAGAIGVGAGTCLLVIGPFLRAIARRFASVEQIRIASRLLDIAELLAPGSGVAEEKALLGAMKEIREGHVEDTVGALTAAKERAPAEARLAIDERIVMLYLAAYRWNDAISHAEAHLLGQRADQPSDQPAQSPPALRSLLGVSPPVWVELLGAYGRTGNLDRAASMVAKLEDACDGRTDAALWIHRARLMFLALAGRPAAVRALVARRQAPHMSVAARTYWVAVAYEAVGDREAAAAAYEKARGRSRGRPRAMIDQALAKLAKADGSCVQLSEHTSELVARIEAAPLPAPVRLERAPRAWATWSLAAATLAIAGLITLSVGDTSDVGVLTRSGALVRSLVDGGEWWRIFSCVFVHVGGLSLVVSVIGIVIIGRVAEQLFGTAKTIAIFGLAGFAGAIASYLASPHGIYSGASGGLFALLGAVFVELTWHRERYRAAWQRGIWVPFLFLIVAQFGYGLFPAFVDDQWADGAGLVCGALLGLVLSPHAPWAKAGRSLGRGGALIVMAFAAVAAVRVTRTSIEESFGRAPRITHVIDRVSVTAPATWMDDVDLAEPEGLVVMSIKRQQRGDTPPQLAEWIATAPAVAKSRGFEQVDPAEHAEIALPDGWRGAEMTGSFDAAEGELQRYRIIVCGREFDQDSVLLMIHAPESVARAAPEFLARLIRSVHPL